MINDFPGSSTVKNPPAMHKTWVRTLGWEDPVEEGMTTRCSTLAWRIPWTEEPGGLQSMGWQRVGRDCVTEHTKAFWTTVLGWNPLKGTDNESCEAALCYICGFFHWDILPAGRSQAFYMEFCLLFSFEQQNLFCPISQFMQKIYRKENRSRCAGSLLWKIFFNTCKNVPSNFWWNPTRGNLHHPELTFTLWKFEKIRVLHI